MPILPASDAGPAERDVMTTITAVCYSPLRFDGTKGRAGCQASRRPRDYFEKTLKSLSRAPFSSLMIWASSPLSSQTPSHEEHRSTLRDL